MKKVLTVTMNPSLDKSCSVDRVVADRKLRCSPPTYDPGGGGINVSRAIKKLGGASLAAFPTGGPNGAHLLELLQGEQIDRVPFHINGRTRQNLTVLDESSGQQWRFGMPGPRIDRQEQRKALEVIAELGPQTDYAVLSGSLPPGVPDGFYGEIGAVLSGHEVRIVLDSSGAALGKGLRNGAYLIKPNLRELGQLAGGGLDSEQHQVRAARRLVDSGKVQVVVLSLGSSGVLLVTGDDHRYLRSPTVPQRSRIGAGDSMVAGIVLSLARGEPLLEAVKFGIAAGASAVMTEGTELCRRETTEELYKDYASGE